MRDLDPVTGKELVITPAFVAAGEEVAGLVYDPFTDHLFLRVQPGSYVRVVDRPANRVKRLFAVPGLPPEGHDFAIRSRDRHFFFSQTTMPALLETNINGDTDRFIPLEGLLEAPHGVAYDQIKDELLIVALVEDRRLRRHDLAGKFLGELTLEQAIDGRSIGYDSVERTFFASLADRSAIGVFDERGRLLRRLPRPDTERGVFIDVGPRSLLRMF